MAESVTLTHRINQEKLEVVVDVQKRGILDGKFLTLDLSLKEQEPSTDNDDVSSND